MGGTENNRFLRELPIDFVVDGVPGRKWTHKIIPPGMKGGRPLRKPRMVHKRFAGDTEPRRKLFTIPLPEELRDSVDKVDEAVPTPKLTKNPFKGKNL